MGELTEPITWLAGIVGEGNVKTDPEVTVRYAVDGVSPRAVVFPGETEQIAEAVKLANQENLTILPWGSGSKVATGNPPKRLGLVLCTTRLNAITDVDTANLTVTVQAGVKFKDVQLRLASRENRCYLPISSEADDAAELLCSERGTTGCFLPLDPPFVDMTTMGGGIASNSSGPRRLLYGLPRDLVLGVRFVAPDGEVIGAGGKTVKNVSGYDISKLMIGSYGSLGILSEITLRLLPLPERMETLILSFGSYSEASAFVDKVLESNLLPAALEVMNAASVEALGLEDVPGLDPSGCVVAVALEDFREPVRRMRTEMIDMAQSLGAHCEDPLQENEHSTFWIAVSNMVASLANRFKGLITAKLSYPISKWKEIVPFCDDILPRTNAEYTLLAHVGSGVCFVNLLMDGTDLEALEKVVKTLGKISEQCSIVEGNLVIQRAPADLRGRLPVWGETRSDQLVMKRIKKKLDPSGVMCPGRFVGDI